LLVTGGHFATVICEMELPSNFQEELWGRGKGSGQLT
jgi:hypothetical protein